MLERCLEVLKLDHVLFFSNSKLSMCVVEVGSFGIVTSENVQLLNFWNFEILKLRID